MLTGSQVVAFASSKTWDKKDWVVSMEREDMESDFESWGKTVRGILPLLEKSDIWALFHHPPTPTYYKGRIALLGDAAHATTPHMGSGAGMAMEDAYILAEILAGVEEANDLENAFKAYDHFRRPRGLGLVERSSQQGQLYEFELSGHDSDVLKKELGKRPQWIWNYDLENELSQAKKLFQELK